MHGMAILCEDNPTARFRTPAYLRVAKGLEDARGGLAESLRLPPETELAGEFNVARDTLRRAMSILEDRGGVTRRRGHGTYLHPMQNDKVSSSHRAVGFVPPWWAASLNAWYTATVFDGVLSFADEHCCHLNTLTVARDGVDVDLFLQKISDLNLSGLLWVHPVPEQIALIKEVSKHFPCVIVGRDYSKDGLFSVLPDYQDAAALLDKHAVELGHEQYSVLGRGPLDTYSASWIKGVKSAYESRGSNFDDYLHYVNITPFKRENLPDLLLNHHLVEDLDVQLLLLTSSSYLAYLLSSESFQKRIGKGLSLMVFDYGVQAMHTYWPGMSITHASCDWGGIARDAMEALVAMMDGDSSCSVKLAPVVLVEGNTVDRFVPGIAR